MNWRRILGFVAISVVLVCGFCLWRGNKSFTRLETIDRTMPLGEAKSAATATAPVATGSPNTAVQSARTFPSESISAWAASSIPEPKFARFADWAERYLRASGADRLAMELESVELARKRRDEMSDMIQSHPDRALELAVPFGIRQKLPASIAALLEAPVSGRGTLSVLAALPALGHEGEIAPIFRTATIGDQTYEAFVYGRRLGEPTRENIPLHGVAIGNLLAVHENPARILDPAEAIFRKESLARVADPVCQISGLPSASRGEETGADVGGETILLCSPEHVDELNEQLIAAESDTSSQSAVGNLAASAYTEGLKSVIVIRVDFSDLEGEPFSESTGNDMIAGVDRFYREMSYDKTGLALAGGGSDVTPTFRMPNTAAYYGARDASVLRKDARAAATDAGYTLGDYNFDLICFGAVPGFKFSGLAYVGSAGAWIRDTSSTGVAAHELGHNFGLNHANFWDTAGQSIIGSGTTVEYGDKFDTMGSSNAGSKHFNARYKSYLNWLTTGDVLNVTQSGTYRIFAHDDPASSGLRALRVAKNGSTNYWIEYRAHYAGNKWLPYGAGLRWAGNGGQSTRLLDVTPGTSPGKDDSCILIGRTFSDFGAGIHITPIGRSEAAPDWLEVVINKGSYSENVPPTVSLTAPLLSAAQNVQLGFTAHVSDPNGDALAYCWDFGDGNVGRNTPEASYSWASAGEYLVRCTVTDMKGGAASSSVVVRIGSPSTYRINGRVLADGKPVYGVRVQGSSTKITYTDSDGRYQLVGLAAGAYSLKTVLEGYVFSHPDFVNPVRVGPSRENLDFIAVAPDGQNIISFVAAGSVWQYLDDGSNQGTAWREPEFDDSKWDEGPAPLGYGDDNEKTVVSFGPSSNNKYVTTYFRRRFTVADPRLISALTLGLRRDDGAVVYLNGREVFRSNMPGATINYTTLAASTTGGADEITFFQTDVDPALLRAGTNVFAVEIHQSTRNSTDIAFDLELLGTAAALPTPPNLAWELANGTLKLSWSDGPVTWVLFSTDDLNEKSPWSTVSGSPIIVGGQRIVTITPDRQNRFFRLGTSESR